MQKKLNRLLFFATVIVTGLAVLDQMRRPAAERDWHGTIVVVPYDFRMPSLQRFLDAWWNPDDPRLFTPRDFGIGWAINIPRLLSTITGLVRNRGS
jgi:hypothetical protein